MVLTSFDESNCILNGTETAAAALVIYDSNNKPSVVTCWKLDKIDLEEILRTGRCYLVVEGLQVPSCYISVLKPFELKHDDNSYPSPSDN